MGSPYRRGRGGLRLHREPADASHAQNGDNAIGPGEHREAIGPAQLPKISSTVAAVVTLPAGPGPRRECARSLSSCAAGGPDFAGPARARIGSVSAHHHAARPRLAAPWAAVLVGQLVGATRNLFSVAIGACADCHAPGLAATRRPRAVVGGDRVAHQRALTPSRARSASACAFSSSVRPAFQTSSDARLRWRSCESRRACHRRTRPRIRTTRPRRRRCRRRRPDHRPAYFPLAAIWPTTATAASTCPLAIVTRSALGGISLRRCTGTGQRSATTPVFRSYSGGLMLALLCVCWRGIPTGRERRRASSC